ncbi:MAG: Selenoprotein O and cysteine-containing homologs [uncultured Sulfurovum sp.]|uniref:Protein nucleotidyltransferase YdiU n=1 Tax=uncultured Sulfurovum sp. TaxID=269237 RepID=A0A6S6SVM3_9BACT|nr:MAG: Selenoprotein O and cysteine-containing homologs [uncultured Sulfurovum sp.]
MILENLNFKSNYLSLDNEFYEFTKPTPLDEPYLLSFNLKVAKLIELDEKSVDDPRFIQFLNGTFIPKNVQPFSMCYAGHQFGHYAQRLGDGRAINYGSINGWHLQTKGSGETAFSRTADGRAALPSTIREYLMSEAMHHLGIPSTRALGMIGSQTKLLRNGIEKGAVVMRMSKSWVRFGTFQYFTYFKEYEKLKALAEYVIEESYPHLKNDEDRYFKLFSEVVERTATLVASWQGVGFCHGVMNTDNMSIAGLTLDYGPFSMLDDFDFGFVCNSTDKAGRYAYGEQPNISYWNLTKLAQAFAPMVDKKRMDKKLEDYGAFIYPNAYIEIMRKKLGLEVKEESDAELITELVGALQDAYVDHTNFFRILSRYDGERMPLFEIAMNPISIENWLNLYDKRLMKESLTLEARQTKMLKTNPKYVLKNYMFQDAIALAKGGNFSRIEELLYLAQHPFEELEGFEHFAVETPEHYKNVTLSCSS